MKDLMRGMMILVLLIGVPVGIAIVGGTIERREALKTWNSGTHIDCGGKRELFSANHVRNGGTYYFYKCGKCKSVWETCVNVK